MYTKCHTPFATCNLGVQWKQGVVICMPLYTILSHNTTPIHRTPPPTAPPVMNTQSHTLLRAMALGARPRVAIQYYNNNSNTTTLNNDNNDSKHTNHHTTTTTTTTTTPTATTTTTTT